MTDFMTRFSTPHRGKADKRRVSRGVFCLLVIEESHLTGLCLEGKRTKLTVCCVMLLPAPFLAASEGALQLHLFGESLPEGAFGEKLFSL